MLFRSTDLVSKISTFGLETSATTFVARADGSGDRAGAVRITRVSLAIGIGLSIASAVVGFSIYQRVAAGTTDRPELLRATAVALLALPGVALYRISNAVSRGMAVMHHDIYSRGLTDNAATTAALLLALAVGVDRVLAPEIAVVVGSFASGGVAYLFARRLFGSGDRATGGGAANVRALVRDSATISAYDFLNVGLMQIDIIMLGLFVGRVPSVTLASVGIYAAAAEVAGGLRKVNQAFGPMFMTTVARQIGGRDIRGAEASYGLVARWMLAVLLPALVVVGLASRTIMSIFGRDFASGAAWLSVLAISCALNGFVGLGETILAIEQPRMNLLNAIVTTAVAIAFNLVLILRFGPLGAAIGMLVPSSLYAVLRGVEIGWLLDWRWPWRSLSKPVVAAGLALPVGLVIRIAGPATSTEIAAAVAFLVAYVIAWSRIGLEEVDRQTLVRSGWLGAWVLRVLRGRGAQDAEMRER